VPETEDTQHPPLVVPDTDEVVYFWRKKQLILLGFPRDHAIALARDQIVDLNKVRMLVRSGASVEQLWRILA